jgi:hypothetical protein
MRPSVHAVAVDIRPMSSMSSARLIAVICGQQRLVVGVARTKALAHGILLLPQRYPEASLYCRQSHKPLKLLVNGRGLDL